MNDESFVEMEAQIGELDTRVPVTASDNNSERRTHAAAMRARASRGSLPLSTATDTNDADEKVTRLASVLPKPRLFGISKIEK